MATYYEELTEFVAGLSDKERVRFVYRFILRLPAEKIAEIDSISHCRIHQTLHHIEKKFKQFHSHDEIIAALQEIFRT
jgi:DNA-directed RNA polymerase specialized sigma24 family protein